MNLKTITFDADVYQLVPKVATEEMRRLFGVEPVHPLPELKQPTNVLDSMLRRNALIIANARRLIRDKRMSNSKLYAELFGTGMGIAIKRCNEMGLRSESNKTSYSEMINEIDAQVQAQSCATPANDEPVAIVTSTNDAGIEWQVRNGPPLKDGDKLYVRPQAPEVGK